MKVRPFWLEIVAAGTAVACALALLLASLGAIAGAAVAAFGQDQEKGTTAQKSYEGVVTCSRCGARHSAKIVRTAAECTLACVQGAAEFALVAGDRTYLLDGNSMQLKGVAGQRALVVGSLTGNKIRVSSVTAE
jgi:hypothetical protein